VRGPVVASAWTLPRTHFPGDPLSPAIRGATLALGLGLWPTLAWASPLTADDVVRHTLEHHPDIVAANGAVGAASGHRRDVAVFVDNPEAEVGVAVVGDLVQGGITQPLSLTGEGWHARRAAGGAEEAAAADDRRSTFVVAAEARAAYVRARASEERARLADEALAQGGRLRRALEDRGRAGEVSPLDVRLARLSEARAAAEAVEAHREATQARTALAAFHPDAATAELVDPIELAAPSAAVTGQRSDVLAVEARVEVASAELARARASALPPVGVGAMFQRDAGEWDVGPQVAVEIPLWTRNRGDIAAARAELATTEAEAVRLRAVAAAEATGTARTAAFADDALGRLGDVDTDAREALASVERALAAGDLGVSDAVLMRTEILDGWMAGVDAREAQSLARLDAMLAVESEQLLAPAAEEER
jgi:cobalt-zinc-cadmium efflux system outer membrane protein